MSGWFKGNAQESAEATRARSSTMPVRLSPSPLQGKGAAPAQTPLSRGDDLPLSISNAPTNLKVTVSKESTFWQKTSNLSWDPPPPRQFKTTGYEIELTTNDGVPEIVRVAKAPKGVTRSYQMTHLDSLQIHKFRVRAMIIPGWKSREGTSQTVDENPGDESVETGDWSEQVGLRSLLGDTPSKPLTWRDASTAEHMQAMVTHIQAKHHSAGWIMLGLRDAAEHGSDELMSEELVKLNKKDPDIRVAILNNPMPSSGMSLVMLAAAAQSCGVVQLLIDAGASVTLQDKRGRSALHWAVSLGCYKSCELLLNETTLKLQNQDGVTPKELAHQLARESIMELLDTYKGTNSHEDSKASRTRSLGDQISRKSLHSSQLGDYGINRSTSMATSMGHFS